MPALVYTVVDMALARVQVLTYGAVHGMVPRMRYLNLLPAALLALATQAGDTNFPHYAVSIGWAGGWKEPPHRIRWHDGYYGEELVRVELTTNVVRVMGAGDGFNAVAIADTLITNRVLNVMADGRTNTLVLKELGRGYSWDKFYRLQQLWQPCPCTNVVVVTNYVTLPPLWMEGTPMPPSIATNYFVPGIYNLRVITNSPFVPGIYLNNLTNINVPTH